MRNYFIHPLSTLFVLLAFVVFSQSCSKDATVLEDETVVDNSTKDLIVATEAETAALGFVYESLREQGDDFLGDFLRNHGIPDWSNAVFKSGAEINIASIPTVKGGAISGVFKVYNALGADTIINYYSIADIESALDMGDNLTLGEYHGVRGALSGVIICCLKMGLPVKGKYISWLQDFDYRMDEKTRIICIEEWDCSNLVISSATGWGDCNGDGYFESPVPETECCVLISQECWTETVPRNFPGTSGGGGTTGGSTVGGGQSGTHGDAANIFEIKSTTLNTWMETNGVPDEFFDQLYDCVIYLPSPFGGAAENFVNERCAVSILKNYWHSMFSENDNSYLESGFDPNEFIDKHGLANYVAFMQFYEDFLENAPEEDAPIPIIVGYILKKLAQAGVGALTDFGIQICMEYWMGEHSSWGAAWNELDINEFQIVSSAFEAMFTNKYVSVATSAFSDAMNYVVSTPSNEITAAGFGSALGLGAISGFIGYNAGEYVGKIGHYMVKYGPQKPWKALSDLGIRSFFCNLPGFRSLVIDKAWLNPGWVNRGFALEEVSSYGRYRNAIWLNSAGEQGGPLDFLMGTTGIQLKSIANAGNWPQFKSKAKSGLDQLLNAINSGQCTTGRLDIMMPENLSGNFHSYLEMLYDDLINNPDYPQYANLNIIVGSFIE